MQPTTVFKHDNPVHAGLVFDALAIEYPEVQFTMTSLEGGQSIIRAPGRAHMYPDFAWGVSVGVSVAVKRISEVVK